MAIKTIYYAAGCFWGAQKFFKLVDGVLSTEVGFVNGNTVNPSYKEVYTDTTGFAEAVKVTYDSERISTSALTSIYLLAIDPLSLNRQGEDKGTRYRTGVFAEDAAQVAAAHEVLAAKAVELGVEALAVEEGPLQNWYPAEDYHQDYLDKNPTGYCHLSLELYDYIRSGKYKEII